MATVTDGDINVREIPKFLYKKSLNYCQHLENRKAGKDAFVLSLYPYINELIEEKSYDEVFKCFEESQNIFGDDADVLNILAIALNRLEKPIEALNYLNKALQQCPNKVKIIVNCENIINQWVPRWHFSMLNDETRNLLYKKAINAKINEGHKRVLDIGTGTGLLSVYCHNAGAEEVYTCEVDEIMHNIAENVFKENKIPVTLLLEHSTSISLEKMGIPRFDLIVTEIFDCGAFGEGALATLIHAKQHLLKENGKILPENLKLFVVGVDKISVREKYESLESAMENSIYLKNTILTPESDGPYEPIEQICSQMVLITEPIHAFTVNFNDLNSLEKAIEGELDTKVKLSCLDDGHLEGFLVYFELQLTEGNVLKNFEPLNIDGKNTRCWDPVIFPLNYPMPVRKYQVLNAVLSCKGGVLSLTHEYDNISMRNLKIDSHVFSFLTDDEFIYELEFNVGKALKKNRRNFDQLADFLPFPHIGINFLKENKVSKLYCLGQLRDIIKTIAEWNCIPETAIEFVDDFDALVESKTKFDLIIINPLTSYGTLNEEHLKYYEMLKSNCLTPNGNIFPHKMDLCCKLIHSPWLERVTRVRNNGLAHLGIEKYINQYSTKHQFEFLNFDSSDLSDVFTMATIQFNDKLHEKEVVVNLNSSQSVVNGILYFYKIFFMSNSIPILTNRKKSFCKMNCFVQTIVVEGKSSLVIKFIQDEFAFRCTVQQS